MSDPVDIEILAAAEHESWSGWTKWMIEELEKDALRLSGSPHGGGHLLLITLPCIQRWKRQMETPYADLSEKEKESDRKVAREKLKVYRP